MATPSRRSARLRSATPQDFAAATPQPVSKLSSLVEREDTPRNGAQSILNSLVSTPPPAVSLRCPATSAVGSPVKTGATLHEMKPSSEDMHPGLHHDSIKRRSAQMIDSPALPSTVRSIVANRNSPEATPTKQALLHNFDTPSKSMSVSRNAFSSPTFEFKMTRPSSELSSEARKLMEQVREQAAKIKAELLVQRDEQERKDGEANQLFNAGGRRIATPKGKAGRFSDIHMEQFRKMDSIANHPSSFRADASRFTPGKSLKRSSSKADLDSSTTPSTRSLLHRPTEMPSPLKRVKHTTPIIRHIGGASASSTAESGRMTPTKASLARSSSIKSVGKAPLTTHGRKLATPQRMRPSFVQTEGNHKYRNAFATKLSNVRSILKRPQLRFSDDPIKIAAGTHVSTPRKTGTLNLEQKLPSIPDGFESPSHRQEKHVNFTASTNQVDCPPINYPVLPEVASPTMNKGSPIRDFTFRAGQPIIFGQAQTTPTIRQVRHSDAVSGPASPSPIRLLTPSSKAILSPSRLAYPELPSVPHGLSNKKRKRDSDDLGQLLDKEEGNKENQLAKSPTKSFTRSPIVDLSEGSPRKRLRKTPLTSSATSAAKTITKISAPQADKNAGKVTGAAARIARATVQNNAKASTKPKTGLRPSSANILNVGKPGAESSKGKGKSKTILSLSRLNALAMPKSRKQ